MLRFILICCFIVGFGASSFALAPPLEREVNLTLVNEKISTALTKIQDQTGLIFSYQPSVINNLGTVSLRLKRKTVREALAMMFPKTITYKTRSNYIILKEKPIEKNPKKTELSGYVYDKTTNSKLANVTIYDKNTLQSVTTNEYGYYSISLPNNNQCLSVNKENYQDTCVSVTYMKDTTITNITIQPVSDSVRAQDSLYWRQKLRDFSQATNDFFKKFKGYVNTLNVKDTLTRNFQVSFLPFIGSNGLMSANVYNHFSFNVLGGYSRGTKILEIGSLFNINRESASGGQIAGLFNVVGDTVQGAQVAGLFNVSGNAMNGSQTAGVMNLNIGSMKGVQVAGVMNINAKDAAGASVAGVLNVNRFSMTGTQIAGVANVTGDTMTGVTVAGVVNTAGFSKSLQVAGVTNNTRNGYLNTQIAGVMNRTGSGTTALQIAGVFNRAHDVRGMQIGLINYADSATGVPIGFLSFVKNGKHEIELSADEVFYTNLSFKTGVNAFHNIVTAGTDPSRSVWHIGYGVGTSISFNKKLGADLSATAHHVSQGNFYFATSELFRFYAGVNFKLANKIHIAAGPTFNLYWTDALLPDYATTYSNIAPYHSFNSTSENDFNLKGWVGARVAVRFF